MGSPLCERRILSWQGIFASAVAAGTVLPVSGSVRAPDGVVHGIVGNFTLCDLTWAIDERETAHPQIVSGWAVVKGSTVTCLACWHDELERGAA